MELILVVLKRGIYYAKITFVRGLNAVVWQVCEYSQPLVVKVNNSILYNHIQSAETL